MVTIKFKKTDPKAQIPVQMTPGSAGFDFMCVEDFALRPGESLTVDTGIAVEVPSGYELQMRPRSGLAAKHGITIINSPGTVDSDYRGTIKVLLHRLDTKFFVPGVGGFRNEQPHWFKAGDRIAQGVVSIVPEVTAVVVDELSETERGTGGFGSTGV